MQGRGAIAHSASGIDPTASIKLHPLGLKQASLPGYRRPRGFAPESSDGKIGCHHPMARNGFVLTRSQRLSNDPGRPAPDGSRHGRIAGDPTGRNPANGFENAELKRRGAKRLHQISQARIASKRPTPPVQRPTVSPVSSRDQKNNHGGEKNLQSPFLRISIAAHGFFRGPTPGSKEPP